jgi:hypothetical protein
MTLTKAQLKEFSIRYFPPWDKYYISNGSECYLDSSGQAGGVYYYMKEETAKKALTKFRRRAKK